jgi:twitching motility protein PilT
MILQDLFQAAADAGVSDIHLLVGQPPIFRIDGNLVTASSVSSVSENPLSTADLQAIINFIIDKPQQERLLVEKDLDCSYALAKVRFRVNISYERDNLCVVARVITEKKPTLEEIGMPEVIKKLLDSPEGLILVTGPTGCGKSTTLAAMVDYINTTKSCHIVTLEDPIEYLFNSDKSLIVQRQLGSDVTSFASGLKHVLRQDPNVVMVGEMRDLETISAAITLAETGHLVLATLHTYSAVQTIDRIIDIFPAHQQNQVRSQLSLLLSAVISQRLLPRIKGGRIAAREILIRNAAVSNLIRENKISQLKSAMEMNASIGMVTMDNHLKELYQAGEISEDSARLYLDNQDKI